MQCLVSGETLGNKYNKINSFLVDGQALHSVMTRFAFFLANALPSDADNRL